MAIQTVTMRNSLCQKYADDADWMALYTSAPGASAGTEVAGGSPAYARLASNWGSPASSVITATPGAFNVPASTTLLGAGYHTAVTAGTYLDGASVTSQAFASQGTYSPIGTYTQS